MKEKEIRMAYSEYEEMLNTLKTQQNTINEFKKSSKVVLVDDRFGYNLRLHFLHGRVPKVIADEKLAKEYLQREFDYLSEKFKDLHLQLEEYTKLEDRPKKSFWSWI